MHDILYNHDIRETIEYVIETNDKKALKKAIKGSFDLLQGEQYANLTDPVKKMFISMMGQMDFIQLYKDTPYVQEEPIAELEDIPVVMHEEIDIEYLFGDEP